MRVREMKGLHCAVVEFGIGDSAAKELGQEAILTDNIGLDDGANAMGSYIVGSAAGNKRAWNNDTFAFDKESDEPDKTTGKHRIMLDLDVPHSYIESTTAGHGHLVIDVPQDWDNLKKLLQLLGDMGVLQYGFVDATFSRGETWLRAPGILKTAATEGI